MKFTFYVLNYDSNRREVINFNIFNNITVQKRTEKEVKKFLRNQHKYTCVRLMDDKILYGFPAFCETLRRIIMCEEWSRCEYEILVGGLFEKGLQNFEKWDCYAQAFPNIDCIAREVIYQYKKQLKEEEEGETKSI